jgi:hypothetical protein
VYSLRVFALTATCSANGVAMVAMDTRSGLIRAVLARLANQQPPGFELRDMIYDEPKQRALAKEVVDEFVGNATNVTEDDDVAALEAIKHIPGIRLTLWPRGLTTGRGLYELLPRLKHPDFEEEHEVRAIHVMKVDDIEDANHIEVRATSVGPTPYMGVELGRSAGATALREVIVGPAPHQDLAHAGVVDLLRHHDLPDVIVESSSTPLRW